MLQISASVGSAANGSMNAVSRLRHHEHVALVDPLPAANAGAVEAQAVFEHVFIELADGNREMLRRAEEVGEPQIDRFDIFFAAQSENFAGSHGDKGQGSGIRRQEKTKLEA